MAIRFFLGINIYGEKARASLSNRARGSGTEFKTQETTVPRAEISNTKRAGSGPEAPVLRADSATAPKSGALPAPWAGSQVGNL